MDNMQKLHVEGITCPRCGIGTLAPALVNEPLRVGDNAVEVTVEANVCSYCREHWFDPPAQAVSDAAIRRLREGDISHLTHIGEVYRASWPLARLQVSSHHSLPARHPRGHDLPGSPF